MGEARTDDNNAPSGPAEMKMSRSDALVMVSVEFNANWRVLCLFVRFRFQDLCRDFIFVDNLHRNGEIS